MGLREELQASLGQSYVLQRELAGGGMAQVFLAEETHLRRRVVIKVLTRETAAELSAERFTREVQLAAQLQHANIVPLLTAGTAGALPFYTMPYVEGESLRKRISAGPLPVAETISILRDITRALAYAHAHGVVHRDIKPDNVLISGDAAVVTDFGIAKAIVSARDPALAPNDVPTLTQVGTVIGTPAYMAPEQAAGDPMSDHRADIYSLGVLAYELLTGETPFAGHSTHQLIQAKMATAARPVSELRPTTPPSLAAIVMKCLESNPADRPHSASDISAMLAIATGEVSVSNERRLPRRRKSVLFGAALVAVAAALLVTLRFMGVGPTTFSLSKDLASKGRILVADFEGDVDSSLATTVTELFRIALGQSHSILTIDRAALGTTLQRMNQPAESKIVGPIAREVALREGMTGIVEGRIMDRGGTRVLTAKLVSPQSGAILASAAQTASSEQDVIPAVGRLSNALRAELGESINALQATPPLEQVTTISLEALRKYTAALAANRAQDDAASTALLREAIALDTNFAMAYRKLGNNLYWTRERPQAIAYIRKAYSLRDRLTDTERNLLLGTYYSKVAVDISKAKAAFEAVLANDPDNLIALDNIGSIATLHTHDCRRAETAYGRIAQRERTSLTLSNLAQAQDACGEFFSADSTYRAALALSKPGGNIAPESMGMFHFGNVRQYDSAERYARMALDWPGVDRTTRGSALRGLASIARVQGRLSEASALLNDVAAIERGRGNAASALVAELRIARANLQLLGDSHIALAQVQSIHRRVKQLPPAEWPVEDLADMYARLGDARTARDLIAEQTRLAPNGPVIDLTHDSHLGAEIAEAEGRIHDAISMRRRLNADVDCHGCEDSALGFDFMKLGQADSAIVALERYLTTYLDGRVGIDSWNLPRVYHRLGELYESKGRRAEAAMYFTKFARLWQRADPVLQPTVQEAIRRAAALNSGVGAH